MTSLYDGIMEGLTEALAYAKGKLSEDAVVHEVSIEDAPEFSSEDIREIHK